MQRILSNLFSIISCKIELSLFWGVKLNAFCSIQRRTALLSMIRAPLMFLRSVQLRFTLLSFTAHLWQETSAAGEKSDCLRHQQVLLLLPQVQGFRVAQPDQQTWQAAPVVLMLISDPTLHLHVTIFNLSKICKYANYLPALTLLPPSPCDGVRSTLGASCFFGPQV